MDIKRTVIITSTKTRAIPIPKKKSSFGNI